MGDVHVEGHRGLFWTAHSAKLVFIPMQKCEQKLNRIILTDLFTLWISLKICNTTNPFSRTKPMLTSPMQTVPDQSCMTLASSCWYPMKEDNKSFQKEIVHKFLSNSSPNPDFLFFRAHCTLFSAWGVILSKVHMYISYVLWIWGVFEKHQLQPLLLVPAQYSMFMCILCKLHELVSYEKDEYKQSRMCALSMLWIASMSLAQNNMTICSY